MERLDKFLCDCGAGTRTQVKALIKQGAVTVNGTVVRDGGLKIQPEAQTVTLNGTVMTAKGMAVVMLNKPAGYITATEDSSQKTVMELLPQEMRSWDLKPVGRLDKDTEGLLLFTNDGTLLHQLISPNHQVPKVYYARHAGTASEEDIACFAQGITLGDGTKCLPAELVTLGAGESLITVREGKYHQVRRMMAARGMHVDYLERREEAGLTLQDLPRGRVRELTAEEIQRLQTKG